MDTDNKTNETKPKRHIVRKIIIGYFALVVFVGLIGLVVSATTGKKPSTSTSSRTNSSSSEKDFSYKFIAEENVSSPECKNITILVNNKKPSRDYMVNLGNVLRTDYSNATEDVIVWIFNDETIAKNWHNEKLSESDDKAFDEHWIGTYVRVGKTHALVILEENGTDYEIIPYTVSHGSWRLNYFLDDFGDYTENAFIQATDHQNGSFDNSATTGSRLKWNFIISEKYCAFILFEYGNIEVKGSKSFPTYYTVLVKEEDGTTHSFSAYNASNRVMIPNDGRTNDYENMLNILKSEKNIKIVIKETGTYATASYYLGYFDCVGFRKIFSALTDESNTSLQSIL